MTKPKLTLALAVMSSLIAFYSCTTKNETPKPVVDQSAVAALQQQYQALATQVLGAQNQKTTDSVAMVLSYAQLQAAIADFQKNLQSSVNYSVQVFTYTGVALPGATVKASQGGAVVSATTGANGIATFTGSFYAGRVVCTVDLQGFSRLVFESDIRNGTDGALTYSVSSTVLMLPTGGTALSDAAMETNYIKVFANYSIVDDTLGGPSYNGYFGGVSHADKGLPVGENGDNVKYNAVTDKSLTFYVNQYSFEDTDGNSLDIPVGFTGWNNSGSWNGEVVQVAYEGAKWSTSAAGSNGYYTIKLPTTDNQQNNNSFWGTSTSSNNFSFVVTMAQFTHSYTQYIDGSVPYVWTGPVGSTGAYPGKPTYDTQLNFQIENTSGNPYYWNDSNFTNSLPFNYYPIFLNGIANN